MTNDMKIIYSLEPILDTENSIFLAGPTIRVNNEDDFSNLESWRNEAVKILQQKNFKGTVYVPEFKDNTKSEDWTYSRQVSWEQSALNKAKVILFWIPRDKDKLPAFATNVEFGIFFKSGKIVVGSPKDCYKNKYLEELCSQNGISWNYILDDTIDDALKQINKSSESRVWFTSDTHWNETRTMQLSKRPFQTVEEMDTTLIKNWNMLITDNDIVYHLGDWGDPTVLKYLKGKEINIVLGNYDKEDIVNIFKQDTRIKLLEEGHKLTLNNQDYYLVHYPSSMTDKDKFFLFGHVHKLSMVKRNGLNVGVDCHNYEPIDIETVEFYRNAILNHYDSNVFD